MLLSSDGGEGGEAPVADSGDDTGVAGRSVGGAGSGGANSDAGFLPGANTLDFEVTDIGCPNGLRVELAGTSTPQQ